MDREVRFLSSQKPHTNSITVFGVFLCAVLLSLLSLYFETNVRVDLFFLFFVQYWLVGVGGIIFSLALFLAQLPFTQYVGIFGISYLVFVLITSLAVYSMRHNFWVAALMFFLGETLFFVSYGVGIGLSFEHRFLIIKNIIIHALLFIPLAFLGSRYTLYEER